MKNTFIQRLQSAWNVFLDRNPLDEIRNISGSVHSIPNHRPRFQRGGNERSIVGAIYNRCAIDVAATKIRHARVNQDQVYMETIQSGLNNCLSVEANIDQTGRSWVQDVVMSMFDEGVVAMVPTDTSVNLVNENAFDILTLRSGRIVQWYPHHVRISVYNDNRGEKEEITLPKSKVGIVENPLYAIMNERNSILQRLIAKLNLLDAVDEASASGKLDIIIQLPYTVKSDTRKKQAEERRKIIEEQLVGSKYGIAYADATEKITQLNRPAENNLMNQIEYLTRMVYAQLGISEAILDGTADENELLNYYNRTVEPIASAIADEMTRKFLTKTARTQGQKVMYFRNLFSIVTPERLADLADKFTRNEIASPNDMRAVVGWTPSSDPEADKLRNRNISEPKPESLDVTEEFGKAKKNEEVQNGR